MGLLDTFKRKFQRQPEAASDAAEPDAVAAARSRARRRLIGATVLLAAGIIGFPLLFETQPRPIPVDVPIEIPQKDKAPPLVLSPAPGATVGAAAPVEPPPERAEHVAEAKPAAAPEVITERASEQGREVAPKASEAAATGAGKAAVAAVTGAAAVVAAQAVTAGKGASKPVASAAAAAVASKPASRAADKPADKAHDKVKDAKDAAKEAAKDKAADAQRAQALLEGKPAAAAPAKASAASAAGSARIVVQAGAYTDAAKLREARAKAEKLGFKTYTQVVEGDGGKRTRVRVGPFATKAEADKAAAKLRAAGLQANLLTL